MGLKEFKQDPMRKLFGRVRGESLVRKYWYLTPVPRWKIGFGEDTLTQKRVQKHRTLRREVHITLLEHNEDGLRYAPLTAFWVNERCKLCTASYNDRIEEADVVWVYSADPLTSERREFLLKQLEKAKPDAKIINHPNDYNAYHQPGAFERLEAAGVSVPRSHFTDADRGKTDVVYKTVSSQNAPKTMEKYEGEREGFKPFEFIDSRREDGLYRRYRCYYVLGAVRPSKLMRCDHWNVCLKNKPTLELGFEMTVDEIHQMRRIAKAFNLQYFAVDFLRRGSDDKAFFTDVNIYPYVISHALRYTRLGYFNHWHTFDTRMRMNLPEPGGKPFPEVFDQAMLHFAKGLPFPTDSDALN